MEWKPMHLMTDVSISIGAVMKPAGFEASEGILSAGYLKDASDPQWANDEGMKRYKAFMAKYVPDADAGSLFSSYGYSTAELMTQILKRCGDDLTRANLMKQATTLKDLKTDLALPGMEISTAPDDYRFNKQFVLEKFNGVRWELFGDVLTDTFKTN